MSFTQETFFNASIRNFSGSVGWGTQPSRLTVGLVEDANNGDNFTSVPVGTPVYFNYQNWQFGGIVQNYSENSGRSGNPVFSVEIEDPRELLSGVQLVLQDYSGGTGGVPNLYNIYGYLESLYGFGGSQANETGVPWKLVRDAIHSLQLSSPISFRGYSYLCAPFFGEDLLPDYYRVGGDVITLMDFINDICEALACDYYISMVPQIGFASAPNAIVINRVSRAYGLRTGAIDEFVGQIEGAVAKKRGYELRNETTSKFVTGGRLNSLYFQEQANHSNNYNDVVDDYGNVIRTYKSEKKYYTDDTILPYWGYDCFDNLIIGVGNFHGETGTEYRFNLDGRPIYTQTGLSELVNYKTDLAEMQAVLQGQDTWETFLVMTNFIKTSPHYRKAEILQIASRANMKLGRYIAAGMLTELGGREVSKLATERVNLKGIAEERRQNNISAVYHYLNNIATEYYGKKFMVRIPFVSAKYDENDIIKYSVEPSEAGYVDEANWGSAASLGYMPYNASKFTTKENRLYAYARFSNNQDIRIEIEGEERFLSIESFFKLDDLSTDSYILDQYPNLSRGEMRENMFVKGVLDEKLVFLNDNTLYSPRVVLTLDAAVKDNKDNTRKDRELLFGIAELYLKENVSEAEVDAWIIKHKKHFGADHLWKNKEANPKIPDLTALPLSSNILRYGPWYISNKSGKVEFEVGDTLVPWKYGGFLAMNNAGWAKVEDALSGQQVGETGSVEFPGVPAISLGSALISSGPIVTDINVDISENGATTTYSMKTWSFKFGKLNKYNADQFKKISQLQQKQRKAFRELYEYKRPIQLSRAEHKAIYPKYNSSHLLLAGEIIENSGDSTYKPNIAMGSYELLETIDKESYPGKAGISLDGIYAPYTTDPSGIEYHNLPHFETPSNNATSPTINDLNPFGDGGIAVAFPESSGLPSDLSNEYGYEGYVKALGLKSPLILAGYGYDTDGNPVPSGGDGGFLPNHKSRADQWKVAPLDVRWDTDRKVWNASGGGGTTSVKLAKLNSSLQYNDTTSATEWNYSSSSGEVIPIGTQYTVRDWLLPANTYLPRNTKVIISQIGDIWYVLGASPPC